jgi:hypothetical protein
MLLTLHTTTSWNSDLRKLCRSFDRPRVVLWITTPAGRCNKLLDDWLTELILLISVAMIYGQNLIRVIKKWVDKKIKLTKKTVIVNKCQKIFWHFSLRRCSVATFVGRRLASLSFFCPILLRCFHFFHFFLYKSLRHICLTMSLILWRLARCLFVRRHFWKRAGGKGPI